MFRFKLIVRELFLFFKQKEKEEEQTSFISTIYQSNMSERFQLNNNNNWQNLIEHIPEADIDDLSHSEQTQSFGFEVPNQTYNYTQTMHDISPEIDYQTIVTSKDLYNDPNPQIIRRPSTVNPVVYNQNVRIRFLQPPPIEQGPLIIKEIREPQPPPPPPLVDLYLCILITYNFFSLVLKRSFVNVHYLRFLLHRLFFVNVRHQSRPFKLVFLILFHYLWKLVFLLLFSTSNY
mgnify:FL=1